MSNQVFTASGLVKRFRRKIVLDEVDLDLAPGEVTVLLGRNGAGKSTLMRLALGVLKANGGTLRVCGACPIRAPRAVRRAVGFVPDVPDAYDWMTLDDFLRFLRPQYPTWDDDHARAVAAALQVPRKTRFKELSRGQGMKAMLVAALAPRPQLLLLDEPFAGLDPMTREEVLRGVIAELREGGRTVLCSTHDLDVAARIADRVAVLAGGKIMQHGTIAAVLGDPEPARIPDGLHAAVAETGQG